ncbi:hypothetical protein UNDYM_4776 [Undibacterium sp. YM2]|nr:hypothetical protein UNDYM_4776 [Undibacterium sp. YM2]
MKTPGDIMRSLINTTSAINFVFLLIVLFQPARADKPNTEEALVLAYVDKSGDKSGDKSVISVATGSALPLRHATAVAIVITAADIEVSGATS